MESVLARLRQVIPVTFTSSDIREREAAEAYLEEVRANAACIQCFFELIADSSLDSNVRRASIVQLKLCTEKHPEIVTSGEFMTLLVSLHAKVTDPTMQKALEILSKGCAGVLEKASLLGEYVSSLPSQFHEISNGEGTLVWLKAVLSVLACANPEPNASLEFFSMVLEWLSGHMSDNPHLLYVLYYFGKASVKVLEQLPNGTPFLQGFLELLILVLQCDKNEVQNFDLSSKYLTLTKYYVPDLTQLRQILRISIARKQSGTLSDDMHRKILRMMKEYLDTWASDDFQPLTESEFLQFFEVFVLPGFAVLDPSKFSASDFIDHVYPSYGWFNIPSSAYSLCWSLPLSERQLIYRTVTDMLRQSSGSIPYLVLFNILSATIQSCQEEDGFDFSGFLSGHILPMIGSGNPELLMASFRFLSCLPTIVTMTFEQDQQTWAAITEAVCRPLTIPCEKGNSVSEIIRFLAVAAFSRLLALEIMPLQALSVDVIIPVALDNINSFPTSDNAPIFAEVVKGYMKVLTSELTPVLFEPIAKLIHDYVLSSDGSDRFHMGIADLFRLLETMLKHSVGASLDVRMLVCRNCCDLLNEIVNIAEGKAVTDVSVVSSYQKLVLALLEEFVGLAGTIIECTPQVTEQILLLPDVILRMIQIQDESEMMCIECDTISKMVVGLLRWVCDDDSLVPRFLEQTFHFFEILVNLDEFCDPEFIEAIFIRLRGNPLVLHFGESVLRIILENEISNDVKGTIAAAMIVNCPAKWVELLSVTSEASPLTFYFMLIHLKGVVNDAALTEILTERMTRVTLDEERENTNEYLIQAGIYPEPLETMWKTLGISV